MSIDKRDRMLGVFLAKLVQAALGVVLFLALNRVYIDVVSGKYNFGGFERVYDIELSYEIILIALFALVLPSNLSRCRNAYVWISFILLICPFLVLTAAGAASLTWGVAVMALTLLAHLFAEVSARFLIVSCEREPPISVLVSSRIPLILVMLFICMLWLQVGPPKALAINDVYTYRFEFNKAIRFPLNYLFQFVITGLTSILVVTAILQKKAALFLIVAFLCVLLYGISTHKSALLYPVSAIVMTMLVKYRLAGLGLLVGALLLAISTYGALILEDYDFLGSLLANRLFFIPAKIHSVYFEIFTNEGYQYWSGSKFGLGIYNSDLPMPVVNYVAFQMVGDDNVSANTGWIANGYANAGLAGLLFYVVFFGAILALMDYYTSIYGARFGVAVFLPYILSLTISSDIIVSLFTGGLLLTLITLHLLARLPRRKLWKFPDAVLDAGEVRAYK
jgi:O-antigen polymerase